MAVAPQTRSVVTGSAFNHQSRIAVVLQDAGSTTTYGGISMPYQLSKPTEATGVWVATQSPGLLVTADPADVTAHYPAVLSPALATLSADKKALNVTLPASLDFGAIATSTSIESFFIKLRPADTNPTEIFICRNDVDLMTGVGTQVLITQKETSIIMQHALSMVVVYVKRAAGTTDSPDVRQITIRNKAGASSAPLTQGSFALADNSFTPNTTPASYTRTMSGFAINQAHYAFLVYPSTITAGETEMVLKTDQAEFVMPMPAKTWASGTVYIYNVEISPNEAQLVDITLADWPAWTEKNLDLE